MLAFEEPAAHQVPARPGHNPLSHACLPWALSCMPGRIQRTEGLLGPTFWALPTPKPALFTPYRLSSVYNGTQGGGTEEVTSLGPPPPPYSL